MRLRCHIARLTAIGTLLGGVAVFAVTAPPAASAAPSTAAAPAASQDGWVRIAHLSPKAPAMDMYLYPFGNPGDPIVLKDVSYGDVSAYMALSPGQYTVAMRGFGAPAISAPALTTSFMVSARTAYTVAALGPGLRVDPLTDAVGSQIMPAGGAATGFGGTAPRPPASPVPWLLTIATGALLAVAGFVGLRRSRRLQGPAGV
jgi:Domain of unknown function (DUF4397)